MDDGYRGRAGGLRQVRRWSNWTAVALIGTTALTTGYFARGSGTAGPAAAISGTAGTAGRLGASGAPGPHRPCVSGPVATSGGSAVRAQPRQVLSCPPGSATAAVPGPAQAGPGQGGWDHEHEGHDS